MKKLLIASVMILSACSSKTLQAESSREPNQIGNVGTHEFNDSMSAIEESPTRPITEISCAKGPISYTVSFFGEFAPGSKLILNAGLVKYIANPNGTANINYVKDSALFSTNGNSEIFDNEAAAKKYVQAQVFQVNGKFKEKLVLNMKARQLTSNKGVVYNCK